MFTVGGEENHARSWISRGSNISRQHRWTARLLALVLLVLLQLESQVHFQTVAATPEGTASSASTGSTSSHSASTQSAAQTGSASAASSTLIDGIILDEDGVLLGAGQQTLSEEAATHLFFLPAQLNFAHRSIGDPHNQLIVLFNRHKNRSVYLGSISGSTAEFSSSYFKEKVIPPGGNTSFNVVFLPRKLGAADGSLLVHTSFGMLRYPVQGEGIECPYRLRPLVGLQAPLNATLSPEITLYNPHDTPLQIVEVYSSGGNFQLELPSGGQEGPQTLWEIPPHSTRTVIRVRFHGRTPGNHIAYVRIKISGGAANPSLVDKMLVVPIEVEITKETGLYSRIPFLELGIASSQSEVVSTAARHTTMAASALAAPVDDSEFGLSVRSGRNVTRLSLDLYNSGSQSVRVKSWLVQTDDLESVHCMQVLVADGPTLHVEFDWSKLTSERRHISGRILLKLERILSSSEGGEQAMGDEEEVEEDGEQQEELHSQEETAGTGTGESVRNGDEYERVVLRMNEYDGTAATTEEAAADGGSERSAKVMPSVYYIPFAGEVLKGSIQYNEEALRFLLPTHDQASPEVREDEESASRDGGRGRELVVRNHFNVPLSITNISVPENCSRYIAIEHFRPIVLQPNDERTLLRIHRKVTDTVWADPRQPYTIFTSFRLVTNISEYELPVLGYSGRLERLLSPTVRDASLLTPTGLVQPQHEAAGKGGTGGMEGEVQELDFGVLPIATIGEALVAFRNRNPIPIPIIHWKGAITSDGAVGAPTITVILRGCGPLRLDGLVFCHTVQPGEWIVYQISVQSGTIDSYQGRFTVKTDYEEIVTPLRFTTAVGELHLMRERLRFDDCFPGKLCSLSLLAASSFPTKIQIESIRTDVPGLSYEFLSADKQRPLAPNQPVVLYPDTVTSIGRLTLDPKAHCGPVADCYSSFDLLSKPFGV
uniref:TMEM131_like domain-containing protein n=1 Tax=Anopheles funestus TaxID=62324 RepID=A0A4Y0BF17_ANOFN